MEPPPSTPGSLRAGGPLTHAQRRGDAQTQQVLVQQEERQEETVVGPEPGDGCPVPAGEDGHQPAAVQDDHEVHTLPDHIHGHQEADLRARRTGCTVSWGGPLPGTLGGQAGAEQSGGSSPGSAQPTPSSWRQKEAGRGSTTGQEQGEPQLRRSQRSGDPNPVSSRGPPALTLQGQADCAREVQPAHRSFSCALPRWPSRARTW